MTLVQKHILYIFLSEIATLICKPVHLANRALDLTRRIENIPGRSPVKIVENKLLRLFISDYLSLIF